ncbi:hypothetical protein PQE74_gp022 [Bacillus phage vB_BanS_Chewbecca]|uniref:Uncharacterized protein n=1 Tax=Bacillus phage vB_BanS_Chewbecca TaxID=2894786 RepID=A0AAE9CAT2_9CAUD|nr:hypothetical protein PQE74_gp022 [Bacillus phage vB_BanS_Chewbecca]UGO46105.1 hypothetical protein CHEWBECCA_22 [Bacillus phage vB_BanS_Chewbecca]
MITMTNELRRDRKLYVRLVSGNEYVVLNEDKNEVYGTNDEYFIYFKNVNFRANGEIDGRYLGTATEGMIDDYCENVSYDELKGFNVNGRTVRSARMVALNNKSGAIIIVSSR